MKTRQLYIEVMKSASVAKTKTVETMYKHLYTKLQNHNQKVDSENYIAQHHLCSAALSISKTS